MSLWHEIERLEQRAERLALEEIERIEKWLEGHRRHHHPHHHPHHPWLVVNGVAVQLIPNQEIHMSTMITVGHTLTESIAFLDQNGNPMLTPVTPDSPPTWSDTNPAVETLTASGDGLTFSGPAIAEGTDTVSVTVVVGGVSFSATSDITVAAAPQVLSSIQIIDTVS